MLRSVAGAVLLSMGVALGALLAWEPAPPVPGADAFRSEAVAIGASTYTGEFSAPFEVEWSTPATVLAPVGSAGVVTRSACVAGGVVRNGDAVIQIDGIDRLAFASTIPFFRALAEGDQGEDVDELRRVLAVAGDPGTPFDARLADAVATLNVTTGRPGAGPAFDPSAIVFLPSDPLPVGSCDAAVGTAVAAGEPILTAASTPVALRITVDPADVAVGPMVGTLNGTTFELAAAGDDRTLVATDPSVVAGLGLTPPLEGTAAPPAEIAVALATPVDAAIVPASALLATGDRTCLLTGTPDDFELRPVVVLDARLGRVEVAPAAGADDEPLAGTVVTGAAEAAGDRSCPEP
jgi:hypothetical protein